MFSQFSSVAQLCPTLCEPIDCSTPGLPTAAASKSLHSCPTLCNPIDSSPPGSSVHGIFQARVLEWVAIAFCPSPTPQVYSNSCPLSWWCHPTISSSVIPFSSHLQSFPASGSFQISHFFKLGGQSTGVSASPSVLPMNIQDWLPLGWTGWIPLLSKGHSRVFSNTTVQCDSVLGLFFFGHITWHVVS